MSVNGETISGAVAVPVQKPARVRKPKAPVGPVDDVAWRQIVEDWQKAKATRKQAEALERHAADTLRAELERRGPGSSIVTSAGDCAIMSRSVREYRVAARTDKILTYRPAR